MSKMYKRLRNTSSSSDNNEYFNKVSSHSYVPCLDIKQECTNYCNVESASDIDFGSYFTITEVKNEPKNSFSHTIFDEVNVKREPICTETDDEDSLDGATEQNSSIFVSNTIIKEEISIECEADVDDFEMTKYHDNINRTENQDNEKSAKRRKKVYKNWRKHTVFPTESDALDVIRNERIWTMYITNRTEKCSKVIYRCRNVKSRGQQCEAGIYLLYSHVDPAVTLFRSINMHTCDYIESKRKRPFKSDSNNDIETNKVKTNEDQPASKRRKKTVKNWRKERTFESEEDALVAVKGEGMWAKHTTNKTDKGNKVLYRCRNVKSKGPQCEAGVYLWYSLIDPIIALFRSVNRHTCDGIKSERKPYIRRKIETKIETESIIKGNGNPRRRKRVIKNWQREKSFGLEIHALEAVKVEQTWTKHTTNKTDKGRKVIYRCRNVKSKGKQCDAGIYLLYSTDATVTMYRSANKHTCDIIESKSKSKLNEEAKLLIRTGYEKGLKPKRILGDVIANGFNCKQIQLNNYLAQLRRDAYQSTVFLQDFGNKF